MGRLTGKNVLLIIPKDYYNEEELEVLKEIFNNEDAKVLVASSKFKEAVGMKTGRTMPNLLIVDAMEGITGDSYVTARKGTRQILGVFHGVVIIGGSGARNYLWKDELTRLLLVDRHRSGMVIAAIGTGVPTLVNTGLLDNYEIAAPDEKHTRKELGKKKALISDNEMMSADRLITATGIAVAQPFAEAFIEEVAKTPLK